MTLAEGLRLAAGGALMLGGLFVFITAVIGNFRFPNAAARMHSAALGDTLGILLIFAGLAVFGFSGALLLKLGLIDGVIPEPVGGAHHNYDKAAAYLKLEILKQLEELSGKSVDELVEQRYHHFRDVKYYGEAKA